MNQLVSVVVPIYKVEPYLRKCVDSLLAQDYDNLEIVLVDDGSPDRCPQIADEYAEEYENVTVLHKQNGGLGDARNYGVRHAKGEWVAFVDSDDYVSSTYISNLMELRNQFHADMAATNIVRRMEKEKVESRARFRNFATDPYTAIQDMYIRQHIGWEAVGKLFRKDDLLHIPFPPGYYEDSACMYKIAERCKLIAIGDYSSNYCYILRPGSILQSNLKPQHLHIFDICSEFSEHFSESEEMRMTDLIFHQRAVLQILRCQAMSFLQMKDIFSRYRSLFKKNYCTVVFNGNIPIKVRIYYSLLCTTPTIFLFFSRLIDLFQQIKGGRIN